MEKIEDPNSSGGLKDDLVAYDKKLAKVDEDLEEAKESLAKEEKSRLDGAGQLSEDRGLQLRSHLKYLEAKRNLIVRQRSSIVKTIQQQEVEALELKEKERIKKEEEERSALFAASIVSEEEAARRRARKDRESVAERDEMLARKLSEVDGKSFRAKKVEDEKNDEFIAKIVAEEELGEQGSMEFKPKPKRVKHERQKSRVAKRVVEVDDDEVIKIRPPPSLDDDEDFVPPPAPPREPEVEDEDEDEQEAQDEKHGRDEEEPEEEENQRRKPRRSVKPEKKQKKPKKKRAQEDPDEHADEFDDEELERAGVVVFKDQKKILSLRIAAFAIGIFFHVLLVGLFAIALSKTSFNFAPIAENPTFGPAFSSNTFLRSYAKFQEKDYLSVVSGAYAQSGILQLVISLLLLLSAGFPLDLSVVGISGTIAGFLLGGLVGSILSDIGNSGAVGASGSGAAIAVAAMRLSSSAIKVYIQKQKLPSSELKFLIGSVVAPIVALIFGILPGIDNWGHIGGLLVGIFVPFAVLYQNKALASLGVIALATIVFGSIGLLYANVTCSFCEVIECFDTTYWNC